LFGGFQIFNKQGIDITRKFSVILKQMFLYFLLNSIQNHKGVTSSKLDETFWFGKDKENATNNRSVNIRKLRVLLDNIGNVSLEHENSYWFLNIGEDIFCDYSKIMNLFKQANKEDPVDIRLLEKIIKLALVGILLPNMNADWIDNYKDKYSSTLIDLLLKVRNQPNICANPELLLQIADVILLHDNINEDAIRIKCGIQYKLGQKGLSKQSFDRFYASYISLLNEKPKFDYNDIISNVF
jgi:two-component SAPR family response regulator